jgi:hypothetical protein
MKAPKTIKGLMIIVAIIGLVLGIAINAAPFLPLIFITLIVIAPQVLIVAICALLAIRDNKA